jgi:hypothetical protein
MGNCCSGKANEGEVNVMGAAKATDFTDILDDREVGGLRGVEKEQLVVKIQAHIRGSLDRKRVQ